MSITTMIHLIVNIHVVNVIINEACLLHERAFLNNVRDISAKHWQLLLLAYLPYLPGSKWSEDGSTETHGELMTEPPP